MNFFMSGAVQKLVLFCPCACQGIFTWGTGVENFCTAVPLGSTSTFSTIK